MKILFFSELATQQKNNIKRAFLILVAAATGIGTLIVISYIKEHYLFDNFIYQKSFTYGYLQQYYNSLDDPNLPFSLKKRVDDLIEISNTTQFSTRTENDTTVYLIVVIGDSMCYGTGLRLHNTFPRILEKKLNTIRKTKVLQLCFPGDDVVNNYVKYVLSKKNNPDLILFGLTDNDLAFQFHDRYQNSQPIIENILSTCEQNYLYPEWPETASHQELTKNVYYPTFSDDYSNYCLYQQIVHLLPVNSTLYYTFGYLDPTFSLTEDGPKNDRERSQHIELMLRSVLPKDSYLFDPHSYDDYQWTPVSQKELHPSKNVHRWYAEKLFDEIVNNPRWKFQ